MKSKILLCFVVVFVAGPGYNGSAKCSDPLGDLPNVVSSFDRTVDKELVAQLTQIAAAAQGRVGIDAVVLESGKHVSLRADEHFPMQSVCKLPISMAVLSQVDTGKFKLDQVIRIEKSDLVSPEMYSAVRDQNPNGTQMSVEQLLKTTLELSDGTTSDVMLRIVGGPTVVRDLLKKYGVDGINLINTENDLGLNWQTQYSNWATPRAATKLLRTLQEQPVLSKGSLALLLKYMTEAQTGLDRLKALLPPGTVVAHKTGSSGTHDGIAAATNDIGLITLPNGNHLAIAVFVSDSPVDAKTRAEVIAKIARAVWDRWAK